MSFLSGKILSEGGYLIRKVGSGIKAANSALKYIFGGGEYGQRQNERLKKTQGGRDTLKKYYPSQE